jgi:hypothetical protein
LHRRDWSWEKHLLVVTVVPYVFEPGSNNTFSGRGEELPGPHYESARIKAALRYGGASAGLQNLM